MRVTRPVDWRPHLLVPETCVWLPIADDRDLRSVAETAAAKLLGPDSSAKQRKLFGRFLEEGTISARQRSPSMAGLVFYPDLNRVPPIANIEVQTWHPAPPNDPLTLEFFRHAHGIPGPETVGEIEVSEVDLPAGPALRIHRQRAIRQGRRRGQILREDLIYSVLPRQITSAVEINVSWSELAFGPSLIKMADAVAKTLTIKPIGEVRDLSRGGS